MLSASNHGAPIASHRQSPFVRTKSYASTAAVQEPTTNEVAAGASQVLPLLGAQLRDITQDLEGSVLGVCGSFQGISRRSRDIVQLAEAAIAGGDQGEGGEEVITAAHHTLNNLLGNVQSSCEFVGAQSARLNQLEQHLLQVEKSLKRVEDISSHAKLVALNGQIEAARVGEAGKAFSVVAQETKSLAVNAAEASTTIKALIETLAEALRSTAADLDARTQQDFAVLNDSQLAVSSTLQKLQATNQAMSTSLSNTTQINREIQVDIGKAVMAMQFQDRINQRLDHVIEALHELSSDLRPPENSVALNTVQVLVGNWTTWFTSLSTMESERNFGNDSNTNTAAGGENYAAECTVELF
jgi:methyl-accepting chemotaxis protein